MPQVKDWALVHGMAQFIIYPDDLLQDGFIECAKGERRGEILYSSHVTSTWVPPVTCRRYSGVSGTPVASVPAAG